MFKSAERKRSQGFTLAEVLIVVAIIGILLAVAIPNVISYYRSLKLTELDDSAKTIFMAAQSRLTAMTSAGQKLKDDTSGHQGTGKCGYDVGVAAGDPVPEVDFTYVTFEHSDIHDLLPGGSIESQLQQNDYVIEYSPETGAVHAVWYWEKDTAFSYDNDYLESETANSERLKDNKMVGYYGGRGVVRPMVDQMPIPELSLTNAEELRLTVKIPTMDTSIVGSSFDRTKIMVDVLVDGNPIVMGASLWDEGQTGTVVLDTLRSDYSVAKPTNGGSDWTVGTEFKNWTVYDSSGNSTTKLLTTFVTPGNDITVTVKVYYEGDAQLAAGTGHLISQSASVRTNSLFASVKDDGTDKVAEIAYGRHLQNLDIDTSGVTSSITAAEQTRDINFFQKNPDSATKPEDNIKFWASTYEDTTNDYNKATTFEPITNNALTSYNGGDHQIRNLDISVASGNAGLFASTTTSGFTFENLTLVNPHVIGTGTNFGALVGSAGGVTVKNCGVYDAFENDTIDPSSVGTLLSTTKTLENLDTGLTELDGMPHIGSASATTAGGLIGSASDAVNITGSFASAVTVGSANAGGLVGSADGNVEIGTSYAAGFVFGTVNCAGLVGNVAGSASTVKIENSYAAGEIMDANTSTGFNGAGLFNLASSGANTDGVERCYAAVKYVAATGCDIDKVYGTFKGDSATSTNYYVKQGGVNYETGCGNGVGMSTLKGKIGTVPFDSDKWYNPGTGVTVNPQGLTVPYNMIDGIKLNDPYPYPMLASDITAVGSTTTLPMPHYGDWVEDNANTLLVYYEKYSDNIYGFYAAETKDGTTTSVILNTLKAGTPGKDDNPIVVDDGYRIVSINEVTDYTIDAAYKPNGADNSYILEKDDNIAKAFGGAIKNGLSVSGFESDSTIYAYKFDTKESIKDYYSLLEVGSKKFLYNPLFACETFDVTECAAAPDPKVKLVKPEAAGKDAGGNVAEFKDSKGDGKTDTEDVVIRSARHEGFMVRYTNETGLTGESWQYVQVMDVDYETYTGRVMNGSGKDKDGNNVRQSAAKLNSGKYYGNDFVIRNVYVGGDLVDSSMGFFGVVKGESVLDGIRLVNANVNTSKSRNLGGLVGLLDGKSKVNDCGIYVESREKDKGTGKQHCYLIYAVSDIDCVDYSSVGGLIGKMDSPDASATNSFAAVKVYGGRTGSAKIIQCYVGGFAGVLKGTVENCYSGGYTAGAGYSKDSVNVSTNAGYVGGFVGSVDSVDPKFKGINYSTCSVGAQYMSATNCGRFAGKGDVEAEVGGTLYATGKAFVLSSTDVGTCREEVHVKTGSMIPMSTGGTIKAIPYDDTLGEVYPFVSGNEPKEHHGDWVEAGALMVYFEQYNEVTSTGAADGYGFYALELTEDASGNPVVTEKLNTLRSGNKDYVHFDGYLLVSPADNLTGANYTIDGATQNDLKSETDANLTAALTTALTAKEGFAEYKNVYTFHTDSTKSNKYTDDTPVIGLYHKLELNGQTFYYNPHFACEAYTVPAGAAAPTKPAEWLAKPGAGGTGTTDPTVTDPYAKSVVVRTARHLGFMAAYTYDEDTDRTLKADAQKCAYHQLLNIDYNTYNGDALTAGADGQYGKVGQKDHANSLNSNFQNPACLKSGGSYDGHDHSIENLCIGSSRSIDKSGVGLFGVLDGAMVQNVTLKSNLLNSANISPTATAMLAGSAKGSTKITNCTLIKTENWCSASGSAALVGITEGSTEIKDCTVIDALVSATSSSNTGALVGNAAGSTTITNCGAYVSDKDQYLSRYIMGKTNVGGLIGMVGSSTKVSNCYAAVKVTGKTNVGGFAGQINGSAGMSDCYAGGHATGYLTTGKDYINVTATDANGRAGGFVGLLKNSEEVQTNKYELKSFALSGTLYSTCSVKGEETGLFAARVEDGTVEYGLSGKSIKETLKDATVYGIGVAFTTDSSPKRTAPTNAGTEKQYFASAAEILKQAADPVATTPYSPTICTPPYPYATGTTQTTHHGDWPAFEGAFYWEKENGTYHYSVHAALGDAIFVESYSPESALCTDHHAESATLSSKITDWGYGLFSNAADIESSLKNIATNNFGGVDNFTAAQDAPTEFKAAYPGTTVVMVQPAEPSDTSKLYSSFELTKNSHRYFELNRRFADAIDVVYTQNSDTAKPTNMGTDKAHAYQIRTVQQLDCIPNGDSAHYVQTHDLYGQGSVGSARYPGNNSVTYAYNGPGSDATASYSNGFSGTYDGRLYRILELSIDCMKNTTTKYAGLFGDVDGGTLENIILYSPSGKATITAADDDSQGAAGLAVEAGGTIRNCVVAGYTITVPKDGYAGGLVAQAVPGPSGGPSGGEDLTVQNCAAVNTIEFTAPGGPVAGGLIGKVNSYGDSSFSFENCYAGGAIKIKNDPILYGIEVGGILGSTKIDAEITYKNNYSYVDLTQATSSNVLGYDDFCNYYGIGPRPGGSGSASGSASYEKCYYWSGGIPDGKTPADPVGAGIDITSCKLADLTKLKTTTGNAFNGSAAQHTFVPVKDDAAKGLTDKNTTNPYPFPAVVHELDENGEPKGALVHYGDWPQDMAAAFYWEKEQVYSWNGSSWVKTGDPEYHYHLMGVSELTENPNKHHDVNTLCKEHHDDGMIHQIDDYGYGFLTLGDNGSSVTHDDISGSLVKMDDDKGDGKEVKTAIEAALGCATKTFEIYSANKEMTAFSEVKVTTSLPGGDTSRTLYFDNFFADLRETKYGANPNNKTFTIRAMRQLDNIIANTPNTYEQAHDVGAVGYNIKTAYHNSTDVANDSGLPAKYEYSEYTAPDIRDLTYDGQYYRILELSLYSVEDVALFKIARGTNTLENMVLYSPSGKARIEATDDQKAAGGLIAYLDVGTSANGWSTTINNCAVAGYTFYTPRNTAGGLVGYANHNLTITNCEAVNTFDRKSDEYITGKGDNPLGIGGLVGPVGNGIDGNPRLTIQNSYAGGKITGNSTLGSVGGLYGGGRKPTTLRISNAYSYMNLSSCWMDTSNLGAVDMETVNTRKEVNTIGHGASGTNLYYYNGSGYLPSYTTESNHNWDYQGEGDGQGNATSNLGTISIGKQPDKSYVPGNDGLTDKGQQTSLRAVVKDADGKYVHYGELPTP